ncbi:MAG: fibronectin type III domain-containing protein, partial [Actinobacteria bacterium]|nr:fibronectin type III domain-containing protein [Actinomycetota bacterium]
MKIRSWVLVMMATVVSMLSFNVSMASAVNPSTLPGKPSTASFVASSTGATSMTSGIITVMWNPPAPFTGPAVDRYDVEITRHADGSHFASCSLDIPDPANAPPLMCSFSDVPTGVAFDGTLAAHNSLGLGEAAVNGALILPVGVPDASTAITVVPGSSSLTTSWSAPVNTGGSSLIDYTVNAYDPSTILPVDNCQVTVPAALSCKISNLQTGVDYLIGITASNLEGLGIGGFASPDQSTVNASSGGGGTTATITWTLNPRVPIGSEYYAQAYDDEGAGVPGAVCQTQTASCTITGLDPTKVYTYEVINGIYPLVAGAPQNQPNKPTGTSADSSVPVTWTTPGNNTGVTYEVQAYDALGNKVTGANGAGLCTSLHPTTTCTVPGLTNGSPYTFVVTPSTSRGKGIPSLPSDVVIPLGPPSIPLAPVVLAQNGTINVSWSASASNGGTAILNYVVTVTDPLGAYADGCTIAIPDPANPPAFSCAIGHGLLGTSVKYTVSIKAHNAFGDGPPVVKINVVPVLALANISSNKKVTVAVGNDGVIYRSRDGGNRYTPDDSGVSVNLNGVVCPGALVCVAVGDGGQIRRLTTPLAEGAQNWTEASSSGGSIKLNSIACPATCITVGDGGTVLTADSSGDVWSAVSSGVSANLNMVACPTSSTCIIVGDAGTILLSQSPFTSFVSLSATPAVTDKWNALRCPNPKYCLVVGDNGKMVAAAAPFDNSSKASNWKSLVLKA